LPEVKARLWFDLEVVHIPSVDGTGHRSVRRHSTEPPVGSAEASLDVSTRVQTRTIEDRSSEVSEKVQFFLRGISHASDDDAFDESLAEDFAETLATSLVQSTEYENPVTTPPSARTWVKTLRK
jgi:predicted TPR repeat methyltransferase